MHLTNQTKRDKIYWGNVMDLKEFEKTFNTEKQCLDYLFKLRWQFGYRCPRCNHNEMLEVKDYKYKCKKCEYQTSVIAGTLFHDTHISLLLWFRAMWLLSEQPNITVDMLKKELNLGSNRTASRIRDIIYQTKIHAGLTKLQGTVEIYKHFIRYKNKGALIAVAVEITNKKIGCIRLKEIGNTTESIYKFIMESIEAGSAIISNEVIDFTKLSDKKYTKEIKSYTYAFPYTKRIIAKLEKWITNSPQDSSLENCLYEFCVDFNKDKAKIPFDEMMKNAIALKPIANIKLKKQTFV